MCYANSSGGESFWAKTINNRITDPLQLWKKNPDIVDPLNMTKAQDFKNNKDLADKEAKKAAYMAQTAGKYSKPIAGTTSAKPMSSQTILTGSPNVNQRTLLG